MSATRKILLALSILVGALGLFRLYDLTTSDFAASRARDRARQQAELRALEAGETAPHGRKLDDREREARIDDLRAWTSRHAEEEALDREDARRHWITTVLTLLLAGGLGAAVVLMGRKDGPRVLVRLGQVRPGVVVAALVGLLAGTLLLGFVPQLVTDHQDVTRAEERLAETKSKLESFRFDARGNIAPEQRTEFESTMATAKYAPEAVENAKGRRTLSILIVFASTIALALSVYFGRRSWVRSFAASPQTA